MNACQRQQAINSSISVTWTRRGWVSALSLISAVKGEADAAMPGGFLRQPDNSSIPVVEVLPAEPFITSCLPQGEAVR